MKLFALPVCAISTLVVLVSPPLEAQEPPRVQTAAAQANQRLFDRVSGIVFACSSANGFDWTARACDELTEDFRKRAAAAKVAFAVIPFSNDLGRMKLGPVEGLDGDKAIRARWVFTEVRGKSGEVSAALSGNIVYESSANDGSASGSKRIPVNVYTQATTLPPGTKMAAARDALRQMSDSFFAVGEGKI